ncbi:MAG: patatin-like phospholipase family protein [Arenicellales bacterium]
MATLLQGCNSLAYTNSPLDKTKPNTSLASFTLAKDRGQWGGSAQDKTLFVMALSGGGSRAAIWSAAAMLKMQTLYQDIDLLAEVDAISSISGGSMAAAYYGVSADDAKDVQFNTPQGERPLWQAEEVKKRLSSNFLLSWFGNWFLPHNILRFWFTAYDRTDIMAKTLANNLYDTHRGHDFNLGELNPDRPNIILNATISSGKNFSEGFSYTEEDFQKLLCSDINDYAVSRAVMGSASFPAAFNSMTLRNYRTNQTACDGEQNSKDKNFLHVIDGGSHDNLGLRSAIRFLKENDQGYEKIAVILIDAYTPPVGLSEAKANPRSPFDYIIDTNFMDSVNALMDRNRNKVLDEMRRYLFKAETERGKQIEFFHATFESIHPDLLAQDKSTKLRDKIYKVRTSLKISPKDVEVIEEAVSQIFTPENPCLQKIARLISGKAMPRADDMFHGTTCAWTDRSSR